MIDWWPWWITTAVAVPLAAFAVLVAVVASPRKARAGAALLGLVAIAAAVTAPFVMEDETSPAPASGMGESSVLFTPASGSANRIRWLPVTGVPEGMEWAPIEGDGSKPQPYTLRIRMPDGYVMPPHLQPEAEIVTVIRGNLIVGLGPRFNEDAARELEPGSVALLPAGRPHFFRSEGETIAQINGLGPIKVEYVNPSDIP